MARHYQSVGWNLKNVTLWLGSGSDAAVQVLAVSIVFLATADDQLAILGHHIELGVERCRFAVAHGQGAGHPGLVGDDVDRAE